MINALFLYDCGDVTQHLQIQRRRHVFPFAQSLQSLELIHGLEELAGHATPRRRADSMSGHLQHLF